jgi:hypothetical protein
MSSAARGNAGLTLGSHIYFRSLKLIITGGGDDLDLIPPTDKPANLPEPVVDLQCRSDELKNTWPDEFGLPDLPRAAQSYRDKKVRKASTNAYHLSPKAGEVPEDLPQ